MAKIKAKITEIPKEQYISVPIEKLISESNRNYGGMGDLKKLALDIKHNGLTHPPTVVDNGDGNYRIVVGRRRVEAMRLNKQTETTVRLIHDADDNKLNSITLSENVNRLEMHPLDEAEHFKKLIQKYSLKEIAEFFDRTPAGITHRLRLCGLREEIKVMFREGKLNLSGAALIASLPDDNQQEFVKKFSGKTEEIPIWHITDFIYKVQHCTLEKIADDQCVKCKKRTFNSEPGLFEHMHNLQDVCFDEECYLKKWTSKINEIISTETLQTEPKLLFGYNFPKFYPKGTKTLKIGDTEFAILNSNNFFYTETSKKAKTNTAFLLDTEFGQIVSQRVSYKERERYQGSYSSNSDPVKGYQIDQIPEVEEEEQQAVAKKIEKKYGSTWQFKNAVKEAVLNQLISRRIKMAHANNLAALYINAKCNIEKDDGSEPSNNGAGKLFKTITGFDSISKIPITDITQKLFFFLLLNDIDESDLPDIDYSEERWERIEKFSDWQVLQTTRDEYIKLYKQTLYKIVNDADSSEEKKDVAQSDTEFDDNEYFDDSVEDQDE